MLVQVSQASMDEWKTVFPYSSRDICWYEPLRSRALDVRFFSNKGSFSSVLFVF
jgi:hypothetical protein